MVTALLIRSGARGLGAAALGAAALASFALACSVQAGEGDVQASVAGLSVCDETVPADRNIDGIPAYAQCMASSSAAIYSDDGINTSTTQMAGWIRTQYSGGYQCTELAHRYLYFKWDIDWVPRGNAGTWCDTQPPATIGVVQTMAPVHGDIMVLAPGSCGADATTGHVNLIDVVNTDGTVMAVEQNGARRGKYKQSCGKCFLHVMANDGTPSSIPNKPSDPSPGTAGSASPPTGTAGSASPPPTTPTTPPPTVPPPSTTPTTPPTGVPSMPAGVPMAGSAAPPPAVPVTPPATPAPMMTASMPPAVPAAPASFTPPPRDQMTDDGGCSVAAGQRMPASSLVLIGLALFALPRRRRSGVTARS